MKHILLENIFTYKKRRKMFSPKGYEFDHWLGVWKNENKSLLIESKNFLALATKKHDVETGEDQKGE